MALGTEYEQGMILWISAGDRGINTLRHANLKPEMKMSSFLTVVEKSLAGHRGARVLLLEPDLAPKAGWTPEATEDGRTFKGTDAPRRETLTRASQRRRKTKRPIPDSLDLPRQAAVDVAVDAADRVRGEGGK